MFPSGRMVLARAPRHLLSAFGLVASRRPPSWQILCWAALTSRPGSTTLRTRAPPAFAARGRRTAQPVVGARRSAQPTLWMAQRPRGHVPCDPPCAWRLQAVLSRRELHGRSLSVLRPRRLPSIRTAHDGACATPGAPAIQLILASEPGPSPSGPSTIPGRTPVHGQVARKPSRDRGARP